MNQISEKEKNKEKVSWASLEEVSPKEMMQLSIYKKFKEITMRQKTLDEDGQTLMQSFTGKLSTLMKN